MGKVVQEPAAEVLGWRGPASQSLSSAVMFLLSQGQGAIKQGLRKSWILFQPWDGGPTLSHLFFKKMILT